MNCGIGLALTERPMPGSKDLSAFFSHSFIHLIRFFPDRCGSVYLFWNCQLCTQYDGSRPINIAWQLERPIPAKYLKKTNKLVGRIINLQKRKRQINIWKRAYKFRV